MWLPLTADWTPRDKKRHRQRDPQLGRRWPLLLCHDQTMRSPVFLFGKKQSVRSRGGCARAEWLATIDMNGSCHSDEPRVVDPTSWREKRRRGRKFCFFRRHTNVPLEAGLRSWKIQLQNTIYHLVFSQSSLFIYLGKWKESLINPGGHDAKLHCVFFVCVFLFFFKKKFNTTFREKSLSRFLDTSELLQSGQHLPTCTNVCAF